ncbi:MAG: hypothetical protein SNF68_01810 [Rikenellaceae bacterium]
MKPLTHTIAALATLCAVSCAQPEYTSIYDMFTKERELKITEEIAISEPLNISYNGIIRDSTLYLGISGASYNMYTINIFTGVVESKIVPKGRARGESQKAIPLGIDDENIIFNNIYEKKIMKLNLDDVKRSLSPQEIETIKIKNDNFMQVLDLCYLSHDRALYNIRNERGLFEIVDLNKNEVLHSFGEFDESLNGNKSMESSYQGHLQTNPSMDRFVSYSSYGNILYFYNVSSLDEEPRLLNHYHFDTPTYKVVQTNREGGSITMSVTSGETNIMGTGSTTVSDDNFYLLNSDMSVIDYQANPSDGFDKVLLFDRDGKPLQILILERAATMIVYSKLNNSLYTIGINDREEDCLIRYQL